MFLPSKRQVQAPRLQAQADPWDLKAGSDHAALASTRHRCCHALFPKDEADKLGKPVRKAQSGGLQLTAAHIPRKLRPVPSSWHQVSSRTCSQDNTGQQQREKVVVGLKLIVIIEVADKEPSQSHVGRCEIQPTPRRTTPDSYRWIPDPKQTRNPDLFLLHAEP